MTDEQTTTTDTTPHQPLLRVVNSNATPEEVAAIVAVLSALGSSAPAAPPKPPRAWSAPERQVRRTLPHGRGGWRASALPR